MRAYYNENDPYAAQWLRNLIAAGHIASGEVDERSILNVQPDDLRGFTQCHFFAGIGGWSYGARLAGWPDDRELWTGSCPCQPFSVAGEGKGKSDERHLWPVFFGLIRACRPDVVMGEQVAAAVGKDWLDGVHSDLEGIDYACGAAVVPACAVDAPHRRDRLWFVADARGERCDRREDAAARNDLDGPEARWRQSADRIELRGEAALADTIGAGLAQRERQSGVSCSVGRESEREDAPYDDRPVEHANVSGESQGWEQRGGELSWAGRNPWTRHGWIAGADGKARRVEPGIRLLAHGIPARVGKLRAYGNAIVPQVAAEIIRAYRETRHV